MLTIILRLRMINFSLDHPNKEAAVIRELASISANYYAVGIVSLSFLRKMSVENAFSPHLL